MKTFQGELTSDGVALSAQSATSAIASRGLGPSAIARLTQRVFSLAMGQDCAWRVTGGLGNGSAAVFVSQTLLASRTVLSIFPTVGLSVHLQS